MHQPALRSNMPLRRAMQSASTSTRKSDVNTLKAYKDNKARTAGAIEASHVADMILFVRQMPQNAAIQKIVFTPTKQEY